MLDAMPVHLVAHTREALGTLSELGIGVEQQQFVWRDMPLAPGHLMDTVTALNLPEGYLAEINLAAPSLGGQPSPRCWNMGRYCWWIMGFRSASITTRSVNTAH